MLMGNYLGAGGVRVPVMAIEQPRLGVNHPTVVPTNADADADESRPDADDADRDR